MVCEYISTPALPGGDLCEYQAINTFTDFGHCSFTTKRIPEAYLLLDTSFPLCHCKRSDFKKPNKTKQMEMVKISNILKSLPDLNTTLAKVIEVAKRTRSSIKISND